MVPRYWILLACVAVALGAAIALRQGPPKPTTKTVTFHDTIAPIIHAKCAGCHHPVEAAPFSLLTYDDVKHRARLILDVTQSGFMPPWLPAEDHFADSRRLSDSEKEHIRQWVELGMPAGDGTPEIPTFPDGWQQGPPDLILESPAYTLADAGSDVFRNFVVNVPLDAPRWITSIELRATNPRVTHHARLGVDSSGESRRRDAEDGQPGYAGMAWGQDPDGDLIVWAPGMTAAPALAGTGWRLSPQSKLVLHAHLQPSGKREVVWFRIGLRFGTAPTRPTAVLRIGATAIDIPAGVRSHTVTDTFTTPIALDVLSVFPHAHSLCTSLAVTAETPDDSSRPLIHIPKFDENWHDFYRFRQPLRLPAGTRIVSTFTYDNTAANPRNRSTPPRRTVYGTGIADEMADVYLRVAPVRHDQRAVLMEDYTKYDSTAHTVGFRKALEQDPGNPWYLEGLAASRVAGGDLAEAKSILEQRMKSGPQDVSAVTSLALVTLACSDAVTAERLARDAMTKDADYPLAWLALGKALLALKKPTDAETALRKAMALAPGATDAALSLADLVTARGDLDGATRICRTAIAAAPEAPNLHLKLAEIAVRKKDYPAALNSCAEAQRLAPAMHPPKVLLAVLCTNHGEPDRGVQLLQQAMTEQPQHPMAFLLLGQMATRQKQWDAAKQLYSTARERPIPDTWPASHRQRFQVLLAAEINNLPK